MKKNITYVTLFFAFLAFSLMILFFRKDDTKLDLGIKLRQGEAASSNEWLSSKAAIENLIEVLRRNPENSEAKIKLGFAYIQESRESGEHAFYDSKALDLFTKVLDRDTANFEALIGKATVLLSQHHFTEAIPEAVKALRINPYSSAVYGILTDAFVENGDYAKAIEMADKMVSLRPDIRSYSRVSYLREIHGDYPGALEAMKLAVSSGYPGMEQTEWCRMEMGHLFEMTGQLDSAQAQFLSCIYFRPAFAHAYAGLGRIEKAKGNYTVAIDHLLKAINIKDDPSFELELSEVYHISNKPQLAYEAAQQSIALLAGKQGDEAEKNHGHYADKELAIAYLQAYDYNNALKHALIEYNRRPDNIDVEQTLAWVYYKIGNYQKANTYITKALRTNSKNPVLHYQAGLIMTRMGNLAEARGHYELALKTNPHLPIILQWESKRYLAAL
jgi:tetratricopeptide (TPR) repeat protein